MSVLRGRSAVCLLVAAGLALAACGDDENLQPVLDTSPQPSADTATASGDTATASTSDSSPATTSPDKPEVSLPAELPTELVVTDLLEGEGEAAKAGDTVTVNYVGVRSEDGTEFDNSYDRGQPFDLTLGEGRVIQGWDEGLIGVKKGGRRQLDIPASLAYGDTGSGDIIRPGDAISFVVDVVDIQFAPPPQTLAPDIDTASCPAADGSSEQQREFTEYPPTCIDVTKSYTAEIVTNKGSLTVELDAATAPLAVNSFVTLARYHYFDGTVCHRAVPDFVVQCGDPTATGGGGPGYEFGDELPASLDDYVLGALAMANSGPDTNGSQFFFVTSDAASVRFGSPNYSIFGQVTAGLDTTLAAMAGFATETEKPSGLIQIVSVTIAES